MGVCSDNRHNNEVKRSQTYLSDASSHLKNNYSRQPSYAASNISNLEVQSRNIDEDSSFKDKQSYRNTNTNRKSVLIKQSLKSLLPEEYIAFPKGERFYQLKKDSNIINTTERDSLSEKVELFFSLDNVCNPTDLHSFSISIINNKHIDIPTFLGKLENASGERIEFGDSFRIDFFFEREQIIIIEPIINDKKTGQKKDLVLCTLMTSRDNKLIINIEDIGDLEINYKKLNNQESELINEVSYFQFSITLNNDIFQNSKKLENIYYVIRNIKDGKKRRPVYKSHEYNFINKKKQEVTPISLESDLLCNNKNELIFFELYCPSINKKSCIGYSSFTLNTFKNSYNIFKAEIKSKEYGNLGTLHINYNTTKKINFEQFIKKGQINLDIAIDYTESNGMPNNPSSLHYMNGEEQNDYENAIRSCGNIIAYYDYDQLFPVYGFGGIPPNEKKVNHCFNINFNENDPNIQGIDNILQCYKHSLSKVKLFGPTYFTPVIKKVISEINEDLENRKEENHYYILMILTDGIITDMQETIDCIVEGSKLPLSIVIIGIGDTNFTNMNILDGDEVPLTDSSGKIRKRDIVQFVEFKKFKEKDKINSGTELAEEVLKEIPRQIEEYYHFCGKFYE